MTGWLQAWLQGCYPNARRRPWVMWRLGNLVSSARYWAWRIRGGRHYGEDPAAHWFYRASSTNPTSSTNQTTITVRTDSATSNQEAAE